MDPNIIAAIISGIFALIAAGVPVFLSKRKRAQQQKEEETMDLNRFGPVKGLSVVIGIVQKEDDILMVRRRMRIGNLSWQFPAGVVKPGEDIRDAIEKEVRRETGVICKANKYLGARVHSETEVLCQYMHCVYLDGEAENLDPDENDEVRWVRAREVGRYCTSDIFIEVKRLLQSVDEGLRPTTAVGIVIRGGKVLMVRKRLSDGREEWWFPGGSVESGESDGRAAEREIAEETGIECSPIRKLGERVHPDTGERISYWACEFKGGKASLREPEKIVNVKWISSGEVVEIIGDRLFMPVRQYIEQGAAGQGENLLIGEND